MCHKNKSIVDLLRLSVWIFVNLTFFSAGALAWNCTTCDQLGTCSDGSWIITQDVWGAAPDWQQCLYTDSHSHWQVVANLKGKTWVGSYPHASYPVNAALNDVLNGSTPLLAAWSASYPTNNKFDFAFDLWLNGTTYEVMIWLNWKNTAPIGGKPFTNATIDGIGYNVYEGAGGSGPYCISFLPRNGMMDTATNFNLCSILHWISNLKWNGGPGGYFWHDPNFDSVQLGWEICDTYGSSITYTMNSFNVYHRNNDSTPPAPQVEKPIWQANFYSTFPNDGGYGFSDRDGSPAASGNLSTNLTGGLDGRAALEYRVDLSAWSNSPPGSYSGFGLGTQESPLPYTLASSSQASYRIYFSAKLGGTSTGVTNVPGAVDLTFLVPAGTLSPANSAPAAIFDLNSSLVLSTNWQSYEFDGTGMQIAAYLNGAQALFNQYVSKVNQMELQLSVNGSPNVASLFGYDNNNTVDVDNIKVVELVPQPTPTTLIQTNRPTQVMRAPPTTRGMPEFLDGTGPRGL